MKVKFTDRYIMQTPIKQLEKILNRLILEWPDAKSLQTKVLKTMNEHGYTLDEYHKALVKKEMGL